jgi:hypothetical protein
MNWTRLQYSGSEVVFLYPEAHGVDHPQYWLRVERSPQYAAWNNFRSEKILYQVDCDKYQLKEVERHMYAGPNLTGSERGRWRRGSDYNWSEQSDTSPQGALLKAVCPGRAPEGTGRYPFQ